MVNETTISFDTKTIVDDWKMVTKATDDLSKILSTLKNRIQGIFSGTSLAQYFEEARNASGKLDRELLVMRLALGKLRAAIIDAFAPLSQMVLSVLNDALFAAIRFVRTVGKLIRAFFGIKEGAEDAAAAEDAYADSVSSAARVVRRSLASFDKLNRLQQSSGSSSSSSSSGGYNYEMNLQDYMLFNKISQWLKPLQEIDLEPLRQALNRLGVALKPFTRQLFEGLYWAWTNVLAPMLTWGAEYLLPEVLGALSAALRVLSSVIELCKPALKFLWENFLEPMAGWTCDLLIFSLDGLQQRLNSITVWAESFPAVGESLIGWLGDFLNNLGLLNPLLGTFNQIGAACENVIGDVEGRFADLNVAMNIVYSAMLSLLSAVHPMTDGWYQIAAAAETVLDDLIYSWGSVTGWFQNQVLNPLLSGFRNTGNGILGIFRGVANGATAGMNGLIRSINRLQFKFPEWIPGYGGKKFGFQLKELTAPSIPYLAKGAVLPANKPFLAVVGDQRHGTNVEAPLTTIQEAVRLELQDMIDSNMAGQEAITGVLRQILEAVLGISITDGDIALAADRYRSRMAVVRGIY